MNTNKTYKFLTAVIRPFAKILYRFKVYGAENIPQNGRLLLCPNHTSMADPVMLAVSLKRPIHFMAKNELFKNKILANIWYSVGAFPVMRGKGDNSAIIKSEEILNQEKVLGIFLEGTRSKTGEFLKPKPGAIAIANATNTPIVPICISGKNGGKVKIFKKNVVRIGKPINPENFNITLNKSTQLRNASRNVMEKIKELSPKH